MNVVILVYRILTKDKFNKMAEILYSYEPASILSFLTEFLHTDTTRKALLALGIFKVIL